MRLLYTQLAQKMYAFQDLVLSLSSFILVLVLVLVLRRWGGKKLPPSPRKLPIVGNLHQLGLFPHRSLHSLSKRYGHVMLLHFGKVPVVVASSAAAAQQIMKNQDLIFSNRPKLKIPDKFLYGSRDVAFSPYGEYWRQVRSICVVHLLSYKRVQSFRRVREEETSLMVEKIGRLSSSVVNLSDVLVELTNDVVCRVALGRRYGGDGEGKKFKKFLGELIELSGTSPFEDYIPWLSWIDSVDGLDAKTEKAASFFDEFLEGVLQDHRDERKREKLLPDDSDFVDTLLQFQKENNASSSSSTLVEDDTIKALILDMFTAGTDTTVSALEWTIAELIRHPRSMQNLQNEVRQVGEEIEEEDLKKMPYLKAVIKESLRLHPPIPLLLPRESTQDTKLLGYDIPAHTRVMVNAWSIGRDPSVWKNPDDFHPERFLDSSIDFKGLHFDLIPFGAGRRGCPGIVFAMSVDELALAKLVHKFNFTLPNGARMEDLDMTEATGVTVHKKLPLLVVATSRTLN